MTIVDIKALKIFVQIIHSKSFTLAAEQLFVTQPTVSKAIAALEDELGVTLFKKGETGRKREIELTFSGQQVYQHALNILDEQKRIYETLEDVKQLKKGKIAIGVPPLGSVLLASLIAKFHYRYPDIELEFMEVGSNAISESILNKTLDVGVLLDNHSPILAEIPIINSPLCLVSPRSSKWHLKEKISLTDLKDEDFLLYDDRFTLNKLILDAMQQLGFRPNIVCKSSQWDFIIKMVEHRMGVALLPQIYCEQLGSKNIQITSLQDTPIRWKLTMAWNTSVPMTAATQAWLDIVKMHPDEIRF